MYDYLMGMKGLKDYSFLRKIRDTGSCNLSERDFFSSAWFIKQKVIPKIFLSFVSGTISFNNIVY